MKGNNTIPIGGELTSVATGGVVVSADGVRDYRQGKSQESVNSEVASSIDALNALYAGLTQSDIVVGAKPTSGEKNKIYRVPGTNSYTDWMWNGTGWVEMATYSNAIDNTPTANSNNLVKSGGVHAAIYDVYAAMRDKLGWSASNTVATVVGSTYQNYIECDIPANKVIHVDVEGSTGLFNTDALTIKFFNGDTVEYNENITLPTWSKDYTIDAQITKVQINRTVNASAVGNITLTASTSADFATTSEFETATGRIETKVDNTTKSLVNIMSTKSVATVVGSSWYNIFNDVDIPSGTKFSLDISGDTGLWSNNALTIRVYNGSTQVDSHNVYYPIVDNNQYNQNITKVSIERSASAIAVGTITVTLTIYTSEFYNKSEVDSLVGTNYVYVAPSGSDSGAGTKASPFATVNKALKVSSKVILRGGLYKEQGINLDNTPNNKVTIVNESGEKPCFVGNIITESETKVDGYTKVYKATYSTSLSAHNWLFMYGVDDVSTEITDNKRVYVHGRRDYRCDVTRLFRVNGISEIENCSAYAWYQDGSTLYFSRPQTVNSTHPIFRGYGSLFSNTAEKELHIIGLRTYGKYFNIPSVVNSEIVDCAAVGCFGGYGFAFDNCKNLILKRCEAAFVETNWTSSTGDGFNIHSTAAGADGTIMLSTFSLIDCWAHDNFNDGYSDHECCAGHITGGCYEFNSCGSDGMGGKSYNSNGKVGHGGGLTPSHGAHDIIENAISQYNHEDGIRYTSDETITYSSRGTIQLNGVLVRSNGYNGIAVNNIKQIVNAVNCISINNARYGFYCVQDGVLTLFNCKYTGNIVGNVSSDVTIVI